MTGKLTEREAAALGLIPKKAPRRTRQEAGGPYHTICLECAQQFVTIASEDRHLNETRHVNYRVVTK